MNILVTGGAGYIGSHVVLKLIQANHYTVVYDNLSKGYKELIFSNEFIKADIHNKNLLQKVIQQYKIEAVIHFAAFIEAGESMEKPAKYFYNNSVGTLSLLNAMIETGVRYFIFSSTAALYGYPDKIPRPLKSCESLWRIQINCRKNIKMVFRNICPEIYFIEVFQCMWS